MEPSRSKVDSNGGSARNSLIFIYQSSVSMRLQRSTEPEVEMPWKTQGAIEIADNSHFFGRLGVSEITNSRVHVVWAAADPHNYARINGQRWSPISQVTISCLHIGARRILLRDT